MADEVPVDDVLCQAMEYLSKLGSDLHSRSDILKEKKICKAKLKNSHAVQKAAKKVLLICELSKKSLENVERGVKNILNIVDASQRRAGSVGGKSPRENRDSVVSSEKKKDIYYIEYKSQKLKITKKISLKHYRSVRVRAKNMPMSMIDKYPVHLSCKLYRQRKNAADKHRLSERSQAAEKFKTPYSENKYSESRGKSQDRLETKACKKYYEPVKNGNDEQLVKSSDSQRESKDTDDEDELERQQKKHQRTKDRNKDSKRDRHKRDSSMDEEEMEREQKKHQKTKDRNKDTIISKNSRDRQKQDSPVNKKKTNASVIDLSSDEEDIKTSGPQSRKKVIKSDSEESDTKDNVQKSDSKPTPDNEVEDDNESVQNASLSKSDDASSNDPKPMLKLVSLSKLLKPDVLVKVADKTIKAIRSKDRVCRSPIQKINLSEDEDDKAFWAVKRKEVKAFKAKEFRISVVRLPINFTTEFLIKFNVRRVTQNDSVVFELQKETDEIEKVSSPDVTDSNTEKPVKDSIDPPDMEVIKHALLNDSDSEKSMDSPLVKSTVEESQKAKNTLLDDSEPDDNESENNKGVSESNVPVENKDPTDETDVNKRQESSKNNNTAQSTEGGEKTPEPEAVRETTVTDAELAKSSLLENSAPSTPAKPLGDRRRQSKSVTPSKKKHDVDSLHAKNILLTHSSSDEDDEKMKEIRGELLKGSSDEEVDPKISSRRKLSSSDSEIDELLNKVKKKRKIVASDDSASDNDKSSSVKEKHNGQEEHSNENDASKASSDKDDEEMVANATSDQDTAMDNQSDSSSHKMGRTREVPGSSSEGQEDKDIDGLTNMKSLTRSSRRRGPPKPDEGQPKMKIKLTKAKSIFSGDGDGLLEADLSSDEASLNGSAAEDEDLPAVSMSALNGGGGIERLAKDDLLASDGGEDSGEEGEGEDGEQDNHDDKKDDSDFSDTVKARRRKGATISSESEDESRRKGKRDSDFEDSEPDSESNAKGGKKRAKESSGDESGSGNEGKKKRRRIKSVHESDGSDSGSENEGKKHGRKNIRKVMGKNQLEEATKKAAREERERMARIAERQKTYNNMQFDESGKPDEVVLDRVVLDFDPDTKEPLIQVDRGLVKKLKPHQANGIKFMWDACFESVKRIKKDRGSGCILAHCMGLGKTLQVVSLTHTLLRHSDLTNVQRVLVVCPLSTVLNWVNEFRMWLEHAEDEPEVDVYELSRYKQNSERAFQLSQWFKHGGVCVLGYEMFRNLSADNVKKFKKKMLKQFQESLVDPGPDMVVCDEGHLLKNEKTSLSQSMNRVKTRRRIVLTGTPLQNNLKEYYCMVQFVKPNLLGKYNEYLNRFVNPITNGQYTDSTEHDIKIMKRRSHVLHKMLDGAVQRRDYGVLAPFLPPKHEYVLFITLSEVQIKLYHHYLDNYSRRPMAGKTSGFLFPDFQSLQRIWTHPLVLKYNSERYEIMQQKKRDKEEEDSEGSLVDFIDDDSTPDETSEDESSDDMSDVSDDSRKKSKRKAAGKKAKAKDARGNGRRTRANPELEEEKPLVPLELPSEVRSDNPTEWWMPLVTDEELEDLRHSHKLVLLFDILRQCEAIGDKLLVFSQSLYSLDLIEHFLGKVDEATQEGRRDERLGGHVGSWSPGIDYFRLDGSTSCENRSIWCKNFNREDNPRARLFLISTRAGGLGINLVAANRVVIFDVSWNPSHDVQSIFRVYRFGQKKPCYVYRFLAMGTMEEKIYERQVTKQAISKRVIDEQQIDRHYKENDLAELYTFEPRPPAPRPVPLVPKDRLFAEMIKEHEDLIYRFHEHDSLLENKEEETLSEEERKAAWDDFENEKNRPPPQPFNWPMHNGMMPNLLAQQQQQLAFAALGAVLRKDMPGLTEDQIRGMIPLIYGANPAMFGGYDYGLMQKLNDMYKYAPGMVNPAMMNPGVMGAGGVSAGAGGGSSLQYEPPWQRQQQQQQQMRLQQLMQQQAMSGQQHGMGAKLYAGGLGSRDPVAMALQQRRAREIMLGERGGAAPAVGRPRGRPPGGAGRPPATGDVVNLDSD